MNVKLQNSPAPWVDPDDAPELSDEFFDKGTWRVGSRWYPLTKRTRLSVSK